MLTSDEFCKVLGVDTPSRIFLKSDPFDEIVEWFGWQISRTKINKRFRLYKVYSPPSGMSRADFGRKYGYDMDRVDSLLASRGGPIIGGYVVRKWKIGRRTVYQAVRRETNGYKNKPRPEDLRHDPNICPVCGNGLLRNRRITVNNVAHCVPCNRLAFVDLDKKARQVLKIDREAKCHLT